MSPVYETGHEINLANLETLISRCIGFGENYNPTKNTIKIDALSASLNNAKQVFLNLRTAKTAYDNACNAREAAFAPFRKLATRIINAFHAAGASQHAVNDLKTINRKIQGKRAPERTHNTAENPATESTETKKISVSQQSYDSLIAHFEKIITFLAAEPLYNPNEADLKISHLNTMLNNYINLNSTVINTYTIYSSALIARNTLLYQPITGIVPLANDVKIYVKSVFGASSPEYKEVSAIKFRMVKP